MIEPTKGAFHDPTFGLHFKPLLVIGAQDDFSVDTKLSRTVNKSTAIGGVSPDFAEARIRLRQAIDQPARNGAILPTRFCHKGFEDQAFGINNQVAFAPFDVFACVIASTAPFSVVLTDWLSIMAALGVATRSNAWRSSSRNA